MIDIRYTHRETGLGIEYEEGEGDVVLTFPPDGDKREDGSGYVLISATQLRSLGQLLLEIADKAATSDDEDYSAHLEPESTSSRARRDDDIPF